MRWIATLTILLALAGAAPAAGPDEDYLVIYNQILGADALQTGGHLPAAASEYLKAFAALQKLHADYPASNPAAVSYRLDYLADKIKELSAYLPTTNAAPAPKPLTALTPQQQIAALQEELRALTSANAGLEMKLKEALSVHPAAGAPVELEKTTSLEKERDLLSVALEQQKAAAAAATKPTASGAESAKLAADLAELRTRSSAADKSAQTEIAGLKQKLDESQKKLGDTATELNNLKSRPSAERPASGDVKELAAERDKLKMELAAVSKDLADREAHGNGADAARIKEVEKQNNDLKKERDGLKKERDDSKKQGNDFKKERDDLEKQASDMKKERDDLNKQVAAKTPSAPTPRAGKASTELEQLRARVAVLEAKPVPYTAEELAVLNGSPAAPLAAPPVAAKEPSRKVHSIKDLPPGTSGLMQQAQMAAMARRFDDAEKGYLEVLRQDPNNVFVLYNVGSVQFAAHHLDDCEKTVNRALALDPNDPGTLYLLGILRYGQEKWDESLDALSKSAALVSTNAGTQFYLGSVLANKGLRAEAETHLRKALEFDPAYPDAHFNLAMVYAAETPPSLALARWHYQKALDYGHAKDATLEKMLAGGK